MKNASPDLAMLVELREHHAEQVKRIDSAIDLLRDAQKLHATATRKIGKVRARATVDTTADEPAPRKAKKSPKKAAAVLGARPTDILRQVFVAAKGKTLTREDLTALAGFHQHDVGGSRDQKGNANRLLGLGLSHLMRSNEIKETRDGFVARKIVMPESVSNGNGAHA